MPLLKGCVFVDPWLWVFHFDEWREFGWLEGGLERSVQVWTLKRLEVLGCFCLTAKSVRGSTVWTNQPQRDF